MRVMYFEYIDSLPRLFSVFVPPSLYGIVYECKDLKNRKKLNLVRW